MIKWKKKNYLIISTDIGKTFGKIQHPFMIKSLNKLVIEGTYYNVIRVIYDKHTVTSYDERLRAFVLRLGTRVPTFMTSIST